VRRIGKVVSEQVALYGTLTGVKPAAKRSAPPGENVVPLPRREAS
jgi:2-aminoadipate transaminase